MQAVCTLPKTKRNSINDSQTWAMPVSVSVKTLLNNKHKHN